MNKTGVASKENENDNHPALSLYPELLGQFQRALNKEIDKDVCPFAGAQDQRRPANPVDYIQHRKNTVIRRYEFLIQFHCWLFQGFFPVTRE